MQVSVPGQIALVTGGAQGIGRAIALELARSGVAGVCIVDRQRDAGRAACAELQAAGVPAEFAPVDLEHDDAVDAAMAACLTRFGRVDCLVNAAGRTDRGSLAEATPQLWEMLFRVNARAPALLMQRCIADLRSRGAAGSIVNILSINVHCGARDLAVYSASKAALALLTKNAAQAHRFDRIRINGINVGWAATPGEMRMQAETLGKGAQWLEQANATRPFGRLLSPDDVARLALFMLSDASVPMTGTLVDLEQSVNGAVD